MNFDDAKRKDLPIWLNLGCGEDYRELNDRAWVNVDIRAEVEPDEVWDIKRLQIPDKMVKGIVAQDVLEHFRKPVKVLSEWYRVLKKEGVLKVRVPNWERMIDPEIWKSVPFNRIENKIFGLKRNKHDIHKTLWTADILTARLKEAGFRKIQTKSLTVRPLHWHLLGKGVKL